MPWKRSWQEFLGHYGKVTRDTLGISRDFVMYAEEVGNYWKTSRTSPDKWMEKAKDEIVKAGGLVLAEGFGSEPQTGRAAYMLAFELSGDRFKMIWPVLQSKTGHGGAARIQAATALYREVKAACVKAKFLGTRAAFFAYLLLPNGRAVSEISAPELLEALPKMLMSPSQDEE